MTQILRSNLKLYDLENKLKLYELENKLQLQELEIRQLKKNTNDQILKVQILTQEFRHYQNSYSTLTLTPSPSPGPSPFP